MAALVGYGSAVALVFAAAQVLPLVAVFLLVRLANPLHAVPATLLAGLVIAFTRRDTPWRQVSPDLTPLVFVRPEFAPDVLLGLGVPLDPVTMASQNLVGFVVLRAMAFHRRSPRLSASPASPRPSRRWKVGLVCAAVWATLGMPGPLTGALGSAFWGLTAGLLVHGLDDLERRSF